MVQQLNLKSIIKSKWCNILFSSFRWEEQKEDEMKCQENTRYKRLVETDPNHTKLSYRRWQVPFSYPAEEVGQQVLPIIPSSATSTALCSMTTNLHQTPSTHPHTYGTPSFPSFSTSFPFLFVSQENELTLPPTLSQANITLPQTSPCPQHWAITLKWHLHQSWVTLAQLSYSLQSPAMHFCLF